MTLVECGNDIRAICSVLTKDRVQFSACTEVWEGRGWGKRTLLDFFGVEMGMHCGWRKAGGVFWRRSVCFAKCSEGCD
jgi:hypothetical protein